MGRYVEAEEMLSRAWTENEGDPATGLNLGHVLLEESRRRLQAAVGVSSISIATWKAGWRFEAPGYLYWNRGIARFMLGDCSGALDDFDEAQRIDADMAELSPPACIPIELEGVNQ